MRISTVLIGLLICGFNTFAQSAKHVVKFILAIDGEIPIASITGCKLSLLDGNQKDIVADYRVGELLISDDDYKYFSARPSNSRVNLHLEFLKLEPSNKTYQYNEEMEIQCFKEEYLIVQIKNFEGKSKGKFDAYTMIYKIPSYSSVSPKRKFE